jgi:hypothetical protein
MARDITNYYAGLIKRSFVEADLERVRSCLDYVGRPPLSSDEVDALKAYMFDQPVKKKAVKRVRAKRPSNQDTVYDGIEGQSEEDDKPEKDFDQMQDTKECKRARLSKGKEMSLAPTVETGDSIEVASDVMAVLPGPTTVEVPEAMEEAVPEPTAQKTEEAVPEPIASDAVIEEAVPEPTAQKTEEAVPEPIASDAVIEEAVPEPIAPKIEEAVPEPIAPKIEEAVPEPISPKTEEAVPIASDAVIEEAVQEPIAPKTEEAVPEPMVADMSTVTALETTSVASDPVEEEASDDEELRMILQRAAELRDRKNAKLKMLSKP